MHYQVVARSSIASIASEKWEYYPYWSPVREKSAAERLASYAAQSGYEAAILHSVTAEMLMNIARAVVERQDVRLLPSLRYLPGARMATATGRSEYGVETEFSLSDGLDPYLEGPDKSELDSRRLSLELGQGGDVIADSGWRSQGITLPCRMDLLRSWLSLRRRLMQGEIGGPTDGDEALAS